jgi:hypothetical protein
MAATRCSRAAALAAVGAALAGCGGEEGPTPEARVRATLADLARGTEAKDYELLCERVLAPALVEQVTSIGLPCEVALRKGLGDVSEPKLKVGPSA